MTDITRVRMTGPLASDVRGFCAELAAQGYTPLSAANQVRVMAHLSRWLERHRLPVRELTPPRVAQFLRARRRAGYTAWLSERGLRPLLGYFRRLQVLPAPPGPGTPSALDQLLDRYAAYLERERGLVSTTVRAHGAVARRFLSEQCDPERLALEHLTAGDVTHFVLRACRGWRVGSAQGLVSQLRALLRFLYLEGRTPTPLAAAAPAVAGWRLSGLPRALESAQVARLLRRCDRRTVVGRRDFAILLLLVRLGLRRGEVVALELDDLDWRRGEIMIRGKGRHDERLPLPPEVGAALVAYVRRRRPRLACRHLFLRCRAPQGALAPSAITSLVYQACVRAGVPRLGAHRLRHTAATQMLRHGASLPEIAQVLRHRSLSTTAIYAKVDRTALRPLAQPWPGAGR